MAGALAEAMVGMGIRLIYGRLMVAHHSVLCPLPLSLQLPRGLPLPPLPHTTTLPPQSPYGTVIVGTNGHIVDRFGANEWSFISNCELIESLVWYIVGVGPLALSCTALALPSTVLPNYM